MYTTSSVNFAQFPAHFPVLPQPPLSIRLSPPGFTTVVLFILVFLPLDWNCLDRVMRSAARLIGRVSKFDHISAYMRDVLHWLPLRQRIEFRVAVLVWYSLIGQAPAYLTDLCRPSLSVRSPRHLRSAEQGLLHVPFARTSTMQSRAFSVGGPLVWNGLPLALRSLPRVFSQKFLQQLKTTLFGRAGVGSASE